MNTNTTTTENSEAGHLQPEADTLHQARPRAGAFRRLALGGLIGLVLTLVVEGLR